LKLESRNAEDLYQCFMLPPSKRVVDNSRSFVKPVSPFAVPSAHDASQPPDTSQFYELDVRRSAVSRLTYMHINVDTIVVV
jgi:hypothetical protein